MLRLDLRIELPLTRKHLMYSLQTTSFLQREQSCRRVLAFCDVPGFMRYVSQCFSMTGLSFWIILELPFGLSERRQDGSGTLDLDEMSNVFRLLMPMLTFRDISELMKELDTGGDGKVSRSEFLSWLAKGSVRALEVKKARRNAWIHHFLIFFDVMLIEDMSFS